MQKYKHILIAFTLIFIFLIATTLTWLYSQINGALPQLEGQQTLLGLSNSAKIDRDAQGIVTITANNRQDIALATGFVHAQERFFQMDLQRKKSAGELSSLFGPATLAYDKKIRQHRFRERARKIVAQLPKQEYQLLKAYTQGVNQGLNNLKAPPFEYLLLQQDPVEWQEEDSILTILTIYITLQSPDGKRELSLAAIKKQLGEPIYQLLNPPGSQWDATIDNSQFDSPKLPDSTWLDKLLPNHSPQLTNIPIEENNFPGSNSWAISGKLNHDGRAIIANDMHLTLTVPNIWFRAAFHYQQNKTKIKITGLTLPGTPNMIVGSNSHIAWGFTNSYGDWSDVIILDTNADNSQYLTPDGYLAFTSKTQIIAVKGQAPVEITIKETIWGPVIGTDKQGKLLAYRWVAHDLQAVNLKATQLEYSQNIDQAFIIAAKSGIPALNFLVVDAQGNIGWTIMGPIPRKQGSVGELPSHWANGNNRWQGYLTPHEYPSIKNPSGNRLWTANSRVVSGQMYKKLGNGGYALGARAKQIQQNLFMKSAFDESDLLKIALDDNAVFLSRWQKFMLQAIQHEQDILPLSDWQEIQNLLTEQPLKASIDSVAYRFIRNFRLNLRDKLFAPMTEKLRHLNPHFDFHIFRHQVEPALWQLITQQPEVAAYSKSSWQKLFNQILLTTLNDMTKDQPLAQATWGQQNTADIIHPLSRAIPLLGLWLNMPQKPLAGDHYMPRVQTPNFGASQRMVVSPGHEEDGILHMPSSQSSHPWSPYFNQGHSDWEQGKNSAFLPGPTRYTLTLLNY